MEAKASHCFSCRPSPASSSISIYKSSRQTGKPLKPALAGGLLPLACLCAVLALLAGIPLYGQTCQVTSVQDVIGGTSFAPGSLANLFDGCFGFSGPPYPTATVAGQNAYTVFESNGLMEIQIPYTAPLGAGIPVGYGGISLPITITQFAPILLPQAVGASSASAWHPDGSAVSPAAPAIPGETIHMEAVGLGPTSPAIPAGGTGSGHTTTVPSVTLGGEPVTVLYAALGGDGAGIYQVYFNMPANGPSGNQNVSLSIGGANSNTLTLAAGPAPAISGVLNNYSYVLPGAANYGIAPGSIFVIFGTNMATPGAPAGLQDSTKGLPQTLNGASVAVTVAGLTVNPALYYATPTQIAAVLPSNTPLGAATVTVTYDQMTSAPATTQVVLSALGLATMSGDGTGQAMATDANYNFITPTNSAASGQVITLWGSGLGADTAASDTTYTAPNQIPSTRIPLAIYLNGVPAQVVWAGRSGYPGLDQINVQIPAQSTGLTSSAVTVPTGCAVSLTAADSGTGVGSNTVTLPTSATGGACMRPAFALEPSVAQTFGGKATVNLGFLSISLYGSQAMAGGSFDSVPGSALADFADSGASAGGCIVVPAAGAYTTTGLYAGVGINITGPAGLLPLFTGDIGDYGGIVPSSIIPAAGGTFTFAGQAGPVQTIGAPNATVEFPAPLEWTNQKAAGGINRSQGVQLTWTGGDADGTVAIRGTSFAAAGSKTPSASFICSVPASIGQFTVPATILQALPAGAGTLTVENRSAAQSIAATSLDIGYAFGGALFTINASYN
jgi:uncharacterized protein (TIGR03437 family)